ncbi:MAG: hypothetical protein IKE92_06835 [Clostridiales bacterium]|nr:hypothetical protein [Clostridiales bacterium]
MEAYDKTNVRQPTNCQSLVYYYNYPKAVASCTQGNHTYYLFDQQYSWEDAHQFAVNEMNGDLVSINSSAEDELMAELMAKGSRSAYYTGGIYNSNGNYTWSDGSDFLYTNWYSGEPNHEGSEFSTICLTSDGWYDVLSYKNLWGFIVEVVEPMSEYSVSVSDSSNGTVTVSASSAYEGDEIVVTAMPDTGYVLDCIKVNGTAISGNTFTMPSEDVTVEAVFKMKSINITSQPKNYTGLAGSTATFSVTAQGDGLTYQWQVYSNGAWSNSNATGSKTNKISFNVTNNHNGNKYRCIIKDINGQKVYSNTAKISVITPLTITKQPVNYTGAAGSTATFSITAQGDGLTYQWQVYSNGAWSNSNATGSKTNKISFNVTNNHNGNKYRCIVNDSNGQKVYSNTATITVTTPLKVTKQPVNYTGAAGSTASFSVTASGTGLTYQWQMYSDGAWKNSGATGSKTNKISFNVTSSHNGKKYRCIITDSNGQKVYSNTATVTVTTPLTVTKQPANYSGIAGSTASFSVTAQGTGLTYQWQVYSNGAWSNSNATGSKTNKISFKVTDSHNGNKYRCIVKDSSGQKVYSNTATISVFSPVSITKQPSNYTGAVGSTATFNVTASGTGLTYQWQMYSDGTWKNSGATGSKTSKISFKVTDSHDGKKYRCIITDSNGQKVYSNTATVTVTTLLTIIQQPANYTGLAGSTATFSVTAQGTELTYQWQVYSNGTWSNTDLSGANTSKLSFTVTSSNNGMKYRCVITDINGQKVISDSATVRIGIPSVNYADTVSDNAANPVTVAEKAMSVMENEEDVQLVTDMSEENTFLTDERIDGVESEEIEDKIQMPALEEPVNAEEEEATENRLSFDGQQAVYSDGENMKEEIVKGPSILNQPSEFKGKAGEKAIFAVKADGQGLRYQWQYCKDGEWIDLDVEGADIAELVLEITAADNGTQYRCVVTDFLGNTVITDIVDAIIM